ncbi:MAG: hypothetical protein IAE83_03700 [Anaerolinea sp.]|nr:hypothetical protein [Anaerolinea sp.]
MIPSNQPVVNPDEQEINPELEPALAPADDLGHLALARMRAWGTFMLILLVCLGIAWALGAFRM